MGLRPNQAQKSQKELKGTQAGSRRHIRNRTQVK